jgi:predicted ATP-dependent Lon-type protease
MIILHILLITYLILQIYDYWSTIKIISNGGYEKNKWIAKLIKKIGLKPAIISVKTLFSLLGISVYTVGILYPQLEIGAIIALIVAILGHLYLFIKNNFKYDGIGDD